MNFSFAFGWRQLQRSGGRFLALIMAAFLGVTASLFIFSTKVDAVDEIKVKYGVATIGVTVPELVKFSETGEQSDQIRSMFLSASATEEQIQQFRKFLNYQTSVSPNLLKEALNSYYGQLALKEIGRYINPGSNTEVIVKDILAAATATIEDGKISALEILQNYKGTDALIIDAKPLVMVYEKAMAEAERLITFVRTDPEVQKFICQTK